MILQHVRGRDIEEIAVRHHQIDQQRQSAEIAEGLCAVWRSGAILSGWAHAGSQLLLMGRPRLRATASLAGDSIASYAAGFAAAARVSARAQQSSLRITPCLLVRSHVQIVRRQWGELAADLRQITGDVLRNTCLDLDDEVIAH